MPTLDLAAWLKRLESLHPNDIELGLDRVSSVASRLGLLDPAATVVSIAGTNGKGSTTAVLEALAIDAGRSVGVYTSPHLLRFNERVKRNGQPVADAELVAAFESIELARKEVSLTYFEFATLAALLIFKQSSLDLLILEVGLGGRLDAVNIIDPDLAIITSISLDHQDWLGNDRETIALEKAGILRAGIPVVVGDADPPQSLRKRIGELSCQPDWYEPATRAVCIDSPLRQENIFAAASAANTLGFAASPARLTALVSTLQVPGRLQRLEWGALHIVLDVAHNPAATSNLAQWLETQVTGPVIALFAALSDKDIHAMIGSCEWHMTAWYAVGLPGIARALPPDELVGKLEDVGIEDVVSCEDIAEAWRIIRAQHLTGTLVVFGSFHTVAGFLQLLEDERETS